MQVYKIPNYPDYELHYSNEVQLVYSNKREKYLKLKKDKYGYLQVCLCKNGKQKWILLHRLVWQCLKGNIPKGLQINHIDEVKTNNCIENLELVTAKENCNYGTRNTRMAKGNKISLIGNHNRPQKPVIGIKKNLSEILTYPSIKEAERDAEKGFDHRNISSCCNNKSKTHKGYIWFFKQDFDSYLTRFNNNLKEVIKYKLSL